MRLIAYLLVGIGLVIPQLAIAGACCVGSTSAFPLRAGECETVVLATGLQGSTAFGRWDGNYQIRAPSPHESSLQLRFGAAWRFSRAAQVQFEMPVVAQWKSTPDISDFGQGAGDASVRFELDPIDEQIHGLPIPIFQLGIRLPTGNSADSSSGPLMADTTGFPDAEIQLGASIERQMPRIPWSASARVGLPVRLGPPVIGFGIGAGAHLGTHWTVWGQLHHEHDLRRHGQADTRMGIMLVHGQQLAWRAWIGADSSIPIPYLGRSRMTDVSLAIGIAQIR